MQPEQGWERPAAAAAAPTRPPASAPSLGPAQTPFSPLPASSRLLDTPQSMKPLPSPEQAVLEFLPLASPLPVSLPLLQGGSAGCAPASAGPSLFLAALHHHAHPSTTAEAGQPASQPQLVLTPLQWRPAQFSQGAQGLQAAALPAPQAGTPVAAPGPLQPAMHAMQASAGNTHGQPPPQQQLPPALAAPLPPPTQQQQQQQWEWQPDSTPAQAPAGAAGAASAEQQQSEPAAADEPAVAAPDATVSRPHRRSHMSAPAEQAESVDPSLAADQQPAELLLQLALQLAQQEAEQEREAAQQPPVTPVAPKQQPQGEAQAALPAPRPRTNRARSSKRNAGVAAAGRSRSRGGQGRATARQRSPSRAASAGGAATGGVEGSAEVAGPAVNPSFGIRCTRKRNRSVAAAADKAGGGSGNGSSQGPAAPAGIATVTTGGSGGAERRGSGQGASLHSPRGGYAFSPAAFFGFGSSAPPVRIVHTGSAPELHLAPPQPPVWAGNGLLSGVAGSEAAGAAGAGLDGGLAAEDGPTAAEAPGTPGSVAPLFVAGQGGAFRCTLGGSLTFESPGLDAIRITGQPDPVPVPAPASRPTPPPASPPAPLRAPAQPAYAQRGGAGRRLAKRQKREEGEAARRRKEEEEEEGTSEAEEEEAGEGEDGKEEEEQEQAESEAAEGEGEEAASGGGEGEAGGRTAAAAAGRAREAAQGEFAPFAVAPPADDSKPFSMRSLKFKGVYRMPTRRWRAQFTYRNKVIQIGMFDTEEEAARAWDRAAVQYRGAGTKINIPVPQATIQSWLQEKPVGWCLFFDDNDQPLPHPLAGAALQQKQRELAAQAGQQRKAGGAGAGGGSSGTGKASAGKQVAGKGTAVKAGQKAAPKAAAKGQAKGEAAKAQGSKPAGIKAGAPAAAGAAKPPAKAPTPPKTEAAAGLTSAVATKHKAPAAKPAPPRLPTAAKPAAGQAAAPGTAQATPAMPAAQQATSPPGQAALPAPPAGAQVPCSSAAQAATAAVAQPAAAVHTAPAQREADAVVAAAAPALAVCVPPAKGALPPAATTAVQRTPAAAPTSTAGGGAAAAVAQQASSRPPSLLPMGLMPFPSPRQSPGRPAVTTGGLPAGMQAARSLLQPAQRGAALAIRPATAGPAGLPGLPAISIVSAQPLPLLVMAQRFPPGTSSSSQVLAPAITSGVAPLAATAGAAAQQQRQARQQPAAQAKAPGRGQQAVESSAAPAAGAPAAQPGTRQLRRRRGAPKRRWLEVEEEEELEAEGIEEEGERLGLVPRSLVSAALLSPAGAQRTQRTRRQRGPTTLAAGSAARSQASGSAASGPAPRRSLAISLIAAAAAAEAEEEAAAAAATLHGLPPIVIHVPSPEALDTPPGQQVTPAAGSRASTPGTVSTPLSPGRPAHRQRKGPVHASPDVVPFAWEAAPEPAGASGVEGSDWAGDDGHPSHALSSPVHSPTAGPPPLHMKLRSSHKRQRFSD